MLQIFESKLSNILQRESKLQNVTNILQRESKLPNVINRLQKESKLINISQQESRLSCYKTFYKENPIFQCCRKNSTLNLITPSSFMKFLLLQVYL